MRFVTDIFMTRLIGLCLAVGLLGFATGCQELNLVVDEILGKDRPVVAGVADISGQTLVVAQTGTPRERQAQPPAAKKSPSRTQPGGQSDKDASSPAEVSKGKTRPPEARAPVKPMEARPEAPKKAAFELERDPFNPPQERVLPSECPPSMPLCRFDRSQLKLVGVIQVDSGQYKGMLEDPDGRGYFVFPGTQIGGATVTQVSAKGITMHDHGTREDIVMPLVKESKEPSEF